MTISVVSAGTESILADVDGVRSLIPRSMSNGDYQRLYSLGIKRLYGEKGVYNAFPSWMLKRGNSLVFVFSSGLGHGNSQSQIAMRTDDNGETWQSKTFYISDTQTFDNSILDGLLSTGEVFAAKNVLISRKTVSGYENKVGTQVTVSGQGDNDGIYNLWSARPFVESGISYCTGYRTSGPYTVTALFQSADGGWTNSFKSVIAANASLAFSEASVIKTAANDFLAVIREDSGAGRPLYTSRSANLTTWSAPVKLNNIEGTQPAQLRLSDDSILLMVGHRTGQSGLDVAGRILLESNNVTGIACWRSTDNGNTWSNRVMLAPMWSTDGGQPMPELMSNGLVGFPCYLAPGTTDTYTGVEPEICWVTFSGQSIV